MRKEPIHMVASFGLSALCLAWFVIEPSDAAIEDSAPGTVLQEIVVTAQKRDETIQNSASSITVLRGEALSGQGGGSFADYIAGVPSVSYSARGPGDQVFAIRGVSDTAQTGQATQKTVGVYLDDAVVSSNFASPDLKLFDIDRIEVLRGPQGTLYGDGSIGGVIRYITRKPDSELFEVEAGTDLSTTRNGGTNYAENGMVNLPLEEGRWALRAVGYYVSNAGFIDDPLTGRTGINDEHTSGGRLSLRFTPAQDLTVTASAVFQDMSLGERNLVLVTPPIGDLKTDDLTKVSLDYKYNHVDLNVEKDFGSALLTSATTYSRYKRFDAVDFSDFLEGIIGLALPSNGPLTNDTKTFSQELRLSSKSGYLFDWLAGAYFFHVKDFATENDVVQGLEALLPSFGVTPGSPLDLGNNVIFRADATRVHTQYALFGDATYHLTDKLSATAGMRSSHDKLTQDETDAGFAFGSPPFTYHYETGGSKSTGRLRLAYQASKSVLLYGQASTGYRIGGLNPGSPTLANDPNFPKIYQADTLTAYEFGWKTAWFDNRMTLNGAIFYNHWRDVQVEQQSPDGFSFIGNGGAAHTQGLELELAARVTQALTLAVGGSLLNAQLDRDVPALNGKKGDQLPGVAKFNGRASADYGIPLSAQYAGFVRTDVTYVSTMHQTFGAPDENFGDYALANLRLGVRTSRWETAVYVDNVADRRAALFANVYQNSGADYYRKFEAVTRPRTFGISGRFTW